MACSNAQAIAFFADLRADIAFLGSGGFDPVAGLTDYYLDEVATRRTIIQNAGRAYVLADSTKLGRLAPHRVCGLDAIDGVITETRPAEHIASAVERAGGIVITA